MNDNVSPHRREYKVLAFGCAAAAQPECALPMDAVANGATIVGTVADVGSLALGADGSRTKAALALDFFALRTGGLGIVVKGAVESDRRGVEWADVYKLTNANVGLWTGAINGASGVSDLMTSG